MEGRSMSQFTDMNSAWTDTKRLLRTGKFLLVLAAGLALAFLVFIQFPSVQKTQQFNSWLILADYVLTFGFAGPGLTLYVLRRYSYKAMEVGYGVIFTPISKLALISINWVLLAVLVLV